MASSRKYMVRNAKGKEFGPYTKEQVLNFYEQKKVTKTTNLRLVDGVGVATVQDLLQQEESSENKTSVVRLDKLSQLRKDVKKRKVEEKELIEQERVKEEFKKELEAENFEEFKFDTNKEAEAELDYEEIDNRIIEESLDKTVIKRPITKADVESTIVVNHSAMKNQNELTEDESEDLDKFLEGSGSFVIGDEILDSEVDPNEPTRFLEIAKIDPGVRLEAKNSEREIQDEINLFEKRIRDAENQFKEDDEDDEFDDYEDEKINKKAIGPIFAVLFLVVSYMFMFDDEEKNKFQPPKYLKIKEIEYTEVADQVMSSQLYRKAEGFVRKGTYKAKLLAINILIKSISLEAQNNKAKDLLIYLYADLLENTRDKQKMNKYVYSLIRQNRSRINKSHFLASGTSKFFLKIGNPQAAYNIAWNYIELWRKEKIEAKDKGIDFNRKLKSIVWANFLDSQVALELFSKDEAEKTYNNLSKIPKKEIEIYKSLLNYLKAKNSNSEYFDLLLEARKNYPSSVYLLLLYADFLFTNGELDSLKKNKKSKEEFIAYQKVIEEIKFLNFEGSPFYYARLLEHKALMNGLKQKPRRAIYFIKKSLKVLESKDLRNKLAKFELMEKDGKGTEILMNYVVNESIALQAIDDSIAALKAKDYEKAILSAIKATSVLPNDNRTRLNLARVQISRGYFELGLKTLKEIADDNILSLDIQVELIRGYIKAKKIKEAELHIAKLLKADKLDFSLSWQYPSLVGRIYDKKQKLGLAINKLQDSINRNPLNADDLYLLAKIFLDYRKYKRCKYYLGQAMELDPNNIDYHILYAKTIYELQDASTSIGYLKRRLEDYPKNARIMGAIANYYYLAGFNKEFEMYRNRLRKVEKQDKYIFEFLVKASIKEEKWNDVIEYAKKLIIIDPSDLEAYMLLGENLYNRSRYKEGMKVFDQVEERLSTYKKLHYFKAKIHIGERNYEGALAEANKEIEANPDESYGYTIQGVTYLKIERYPDAIESLKLAISRNGKDIEALMALADVRYRQDKFDESRELYNRVKRYDPNNPILYRQLGHIYRKIGQPAIAIENYKVYLQQNPAARDVSKIQSIMQAIQ